MSHFGGASVSSGGRARPSRDDLAHHYFVLRAVSQAVAASHALDDTLALILRLAAEAVGADRGLILTVDSKSSALTVAAEYRFRDMVRPGFALPLGYGAAGQVATTGSALSLPDGGTGDLTLALAPGQAIRVRALCCQPARTAHEILGVLVVVRTRRGGSFPEAAEDLLRACADQAAVAIKREWLLRDSQLDELTGLFNFRALIGSLESELRRADRESRPFSLLMLELDDFTLINNKYGHLVGNMALKLLAETIRTPTRKRSSVRTPDIVARLGGDEFVVILPATDKPTAAMVAERIRATVEKGALAEGATPIAGPMTVSIGVATYPEDGTTVKELLDKSDRAMYEAKAAGKNRVWAYSPELLTRMLRYERAASDAIDDLTGLWCERTFRPGLAREVKAAGMYGYPLSLVRMDFDRLKALNEEAGYPSGDALLKQVAALTQGMVRGKGQVYRCAGDEFAIILPAMDKDESLALAEQVRAAVSDRRWPLLSGGERKFTFTAGVASLPKDTVSAEELVMKADLAVHRGKQQGGDRVEVFNGRP
jgi:diguanylate cyclase (GGDEF)-like protein